MAEIIRMPEVMAGATEAAIQTWLVQPGASVAVAQTIAEIETEKAIVEFPAEFAGTVGRLLVPEGDSVTVGDPILVLLAEGEEEGAVDAALAAAGGLASSAAASVPAAPAPPAATTEATVPQAVADTPSTQPAGDVASVATAPAVPPAPAPVPHPGDRLFASPLVRRLAAQNGVALADVPGTGPNGRVVRRDLERHLEAAASVPAPAGPAPVVPAPVVPAPPVPAPPAPEAIVAATTGPAAAEYEDIPLDRMRRAIARRLTESKSTVPHFYLVADCRVDELLALRARVNESAPRKISVNDFTLKAVAAALVDVPEANAIWNGDSIRRFASVDLAVAVATDGGLTTPVLRGVERMPLSVVSATIAELAERARAGRLKQHELEGGSFSVSNLGMYGTTQFSAILNPPQSGILAVGAAQRRPVVGADGQLDVGTVMTVTLSADHRVLDGALAGEWLAAFQRRIENPLSILI
ncbi:dihydrolipoamide acetyltransferase family protein [Microbacterium sp. ASV49]|uniref:Dihydrolipoamide acetyltransferase component of pyruvate dehydrogenase complex n=1 Tax=Microbacterium candidum TaxID=3041922 RepID=A0ABT7MWG2_9MICO|nr:dihydrolipoamide acetyltransferase family protein [Microbacterium sp. ASV49]MDL9978785.1 dihydrolipoamide acetyltransferase family protein [Microbacterium sp. ASV49]